MNVIETTHLTKRYGKARGIVDVNLSVAKGAFFGFIGPNGAGKSTTIRTLLGLIAPSDGHAKIFGMDSAKDRQAILSRVGYLPSEAIFYPGMKVKEVLKLSADLRKIDCREESKRLCEHLQLDMKRKVEDLSFGNRKKVGIVCALQHRPELIVLDEPTGGLDPLMQKAFFDILEARNKEGATVFLSSHILSEIQAHCTHAAIIREGRIIASDTVDALAQTNAKRVTVHGQVALNALGDIRDLSSEGEVVRFLYSGDMNRLAQTLASGEIHDFTVTEPNLEEIVLHYYEEKGEA